MPLIVDQCHLLVTSRLFVRRCCLLIGTLVFVANCHAGNTPFFNASVEDEENSRASADSDGFGDERDGSVSGSSVPDELIQNPESASEFQTGRQPSVITGVNLTVENARASCIQYPKSDVSSARIVCHAALLNNGTIYHAASIEPGYRVVWSLLDESMLECAAKNNNLLFECTVREVSDGQYPWQDLVRMAVVNEASGDQTTVTPINTDLQFEGPEQAVQSSSADFSLSLGENGVNLSQPIEYLPMLLRLTANDLDLAGYDPVTSVLVAEGPNGPLNVSVDTWDPETMTLSIWVGVTNLMPGATDASVRITLLPQKPISVTASDTRFPLLQDTTSSVFNPNAGYALALHMDATLKNAAHTDLGASFFCGPNQCTTVEVCAEGLDMCQIGQSVGLTRVKDGVIGEARRLGAGEGNAIRIANDPRLEPAELTLAAWVRMDEAQNNWSKIISMGRVSRPFNSYALHAAGPFEGTGNVCQNLGCIGATRAMAPGTADTNLQDLLYTDTLIPMGSWHYWVMTFSQESGTRLYFDGALLVENTDTTPIHYYRDYVYDLIIGGQIEQASGELDSSFRGMVDEVQLLNRAKSAEWVRMSYLNQRPGSDFPKRIP